MSSRELEACLNDPREMTLLPRIGELVSDRLVLLVSLAEFRLVGLSPPLALWVLLESSVSSGLLEDSVETTSGRFAMVDGGCANFDPRSTGTPSSGIARGTSSVSARVD